MDKEEAKKIVNDEKLTRINWFDEENLKENEVLIRKNNNGNYEVSITDERAYVIRGTVFEYEKEGEAYDALIRKARYLKKIFD